MSLLDIARDTLKDLPVSDIVRERLSLAFNRLADAEAKIDALQSQNGSFQAQLERERLDHKQTREELRRLKDEYSEEIRIHKKSGVEFRRGKRTGGEWIPFCPSCHSPAASPREDYQLRCQSRTCGMTLLIYPRDLPRISQEFGM